MKQEVFNKLYHRIQHEPKIYGLSFPKDLGLVLGAMFVGYYLGQPMGLLLAIGASFGSSAVAYVIITRKAKALEGLGNDKTARYIKNCCASNEYSNETFVIEQKKREG